ncbi:trypsin-like peptidase domain-containing protein [Frankia sp. AgB1.9]|uniref:S1C family serine protease n=1 Tax=unclassified Frankia TaxID=2632575 RepID=UPI0019336D10|nr:MULTISPECIES: trypsin-like peptidase domain-containing protein [unclassified Frankia]MBL7548505.1 trypsin-like peptidase domain-containing protein [Frankia sp. AgB1.9]MBL7619598.1 trypsin-like peptidase domain-containing protein [Frankia sp. AgB1.8]
MARASSSRAPFGLLVGLRGTRVLLGVCGVLVVAVAVLAGVLVGRSGGSARAQDAPAPTPSPTASGSPSVADIYQKIGPSVVVVETADGSLGSGVIAADDGTVLTADHVIADGGAITVVFSDGTRSTATVASADAKTDIATLTPATLPQTLVPATLGGGAQVGGPVVAIGNPLGLTFSVSSGVVSGLNRTATTDNGKFSGLIQFDAAVNPGSSGGPLLDAKGLVIGVVVSIADPGDDDAFAGIGFAVPIAGALGGGGGPGGGRGPQI